MARDKLTPQSAQITTATVELRTMTVNGRQVTQAVFKQLYDEPLFHPFTWTAAGAPWCRVNYHPSRCDGDLVRHEHVVWQRGSELRRARVNEPAGTRESVPRAMFSGTDDVAPHSGPCHQPQSSST